MEKTITNNETKNAFEIFSHENLGSVRVVLNATKEEPEHWFVVKDVCDCLGLKNPSKACADLLDDEKSSITLSYGTSAKGGNPTFLIVSESGLYMLIMRSRKPEAKEFQRWVTRDVLPTLRKTGTFSMKESAYRADSKYWFEMYCNILDDYVKDMQKRREEPDGAKETVPDTAKLERELEGVWTNNQMFVIEPDNKYTIIEREMR